MRGTASPRPAERAAPIAVFVLALLFLAPNAAPAWTPLEYAPAPPDNPLKGFVPYAGQARDFPHSLEFRYFALRDLMRGPDQFDWSPIEQFLDEAASRGCQGVFRIWLEYPGRPSGVPDCLVAGGVRLIAWFNSSAHGHHTLWTPDYRDRRLRDAITNAIAATGRRYDRDPRVAFLTAGFLGHWGEWHNHPRRDLWAPKEVQLEVMAAFESSFRRVPILLRYPAGPDDPHYAPNHDRPFGYHDDSFAWATLETGRPSDSWFFMSRMRRAGPSALQRWRTHPIGGEIRPEVWRTIWNDPPGTPEGQGFNECVAQTHATWLMDSSIARSLTPEQRRRAIEGARRLGYELQVTRVALSWTPDRRLEVAIAVRNHGVAPWYADWPVEVAVFGERPEPLAVWRTGWTFRGIQPDERTDREFRFCTPVSPPPDARWIALRVPNPMPGGRPLKLANQAQDRDRPGWLTLGNLRPPPRP